MYNLEIFYLSHNIEKKPLEWNEVAVKMWISIEHEYILTDNSHRYSNLKFSWIIMALSKMSAFPDHL